MKKPTTKKAKKPFKQQQQQPITTTTANLSSPSPITPSSPTAYDDSPTMLFKTPTSALVNKHSLMNDDSMVIYTNNTTMNQSPIPNSTPPPPSSIIHNVDGNGHSNTSILNQSIMEEDIDVDDEGYIHIPSQIQNMTLNSSNTSDYEYFGSPMMTMMSTPPSIAYQQRLEHLQLINDDSENTQFYSPNTPVLIPSETPCIINKKASNNQNHSNEMNNHHHHHQLIDEYEEEHDDSFNVSNNLSFNSTNSTLNSSRINNLSLQLDISQINEMSNITNSVIEQKLKELKHQVDGKHHTLKSSPSIQKVTSPSHSSLHKNYTATVDTDRLLSYRSSTSRRSMHVHRDDILRYVRAIQDPDDQVRRRAIEIVKLLDATMKPPSPEKSRKSSLNNQFDHIQSRVSHNPKTIPKDSASNNDNLYTDFKSKLKMTRTVSSRFRQGLETNSTSEQKTLSRREQVELEKQEFLKKCPQKSHNK